MNADELYEIIRPFGYTTSAQSQEIASAIAARQITPDGLPADRIRFDFINSDGREDCKVITHDEMRARYADQKAQAMAVFTAPAAPVGSIGDDFLQFIMKERDGAMSMRSYVDGAKTFIDALLKGQAK